MSFGYTGKILKIDLGKKSVQIEKPPDRLYRDYLGGSALNLYYLYRDLPKKIDAFDPRNIVALSIGVVTGYPFSGQSRMSGNAISPLTGAIGDSQCGGYWPAELKFAGFDGILIYGKASSPVYLWVHDGKCEIHDAGHLWGKETGPVQAAIQSELGDPEIKVLQIGPAGEKLVRFASMINHCCRANGRTGMGAVMGSKNLKAIAVKGTYRPKAHDPKALKTLIRGFAKTYSKSYLTDFGKYGTGRTVGGMQDRGALPSYNYSSGEFPGWEAIDGLTLYDTMLKGREKGIQHRQGRETCFGCIVRCKRVVEYQDDNLRVDPLYGGPEYETLASFGSYCGVDDLTAICKANEICNRYGMDTISCGGTIAWAMEAYESGELSLQDTGGIELGFGDSKAMLNMVKAIAKRIGFGKLLGEGSVRTARELGKGEGLLSACRGQELPAHMPHLKRSLALIYAVNPFGADHQSHEHDGACETGFDLFKQKLIPLGITRQQKEKSLDAEKIRFARITQYLYSALDSLCLCQFVWGAGWQLLGASEIVQVVKSVTGWDYTVEELLKTGERRVNLMRLINARQGGGAVIDRLPEKMFTTPMKGEAAADWVMDDELFQAALTEYYRQNGWDIKTGMPRESTLSGLGITK